MIHQVSYVDWEHDWDKQPLENGIKINVNLQELISEIVIGPFPSDWFVELVGDTLKIMGNLISRTL